MKVKHWSQWSWLSRHVACPKCGTLHVKRLNKRDGIDKMYLNPVSRVQQFFGAPLYHCAWCRLQFYDLRRRYERQPDTATSRASSTHA